MAARYKKGKKGGGRFVQLPEYLQATQAWATMKPGPRALYIELKRRYNGKNNGQLFLSHRDAAKALNVHRNTVGGWFTELEKRGFIEVARGAFLGPSGQGQAALWTLQEFPPAEGKNAQRAFLKWKEIEKPRTKTVHARHSDCDTDTKRDNSNPGTVTKLVTGG